MKKILIVVLCLILAIGAVGCSGSGLSKYEADQINKQIDEASEASKKYMEEYKAITEKEHKNPEEMKDAYFLTLSTYVSLYSDDENKNEIVEDIQNEKDGISVKKESETEYTFEYNTASFYMLTDEDGVVNSFTITVSPDIDMYQFMSFAVLVSMNQGYALSAQDIFSELASDMNKAYEDSGIATAMKQLDDGIISAAIVNDSIIYSVAIDQ